MKKVLEWIHGIFLLVLIYSFTWSRKLTVLQRECRCLPFQFPDALFATIDMQITVCVSDLEFYKRVHMTHQ